jgi:hypothetical protein
MKKQEKLLVFENADKKRFKKEKWDDGLHEDPSMFPCPSKLLILGGTGKGKSNTLMNLFVKVQMSKIPYKELIVVSPSTSSEWVKAEPTHLFTDILDCKPDLFDSGTKKLLVIDDFELTGLNVKQKKAMSELFRFVATHHNTSIWMSFQSFFDTPIMCRKLADVFILYKPNNKQEMRTIENRVGLDKGMLEVLFKEVANEAYDNICIDNTVGSPYKLRKNIYEIIELAE